MPSISLFYNESQPIPGMNPGLCSGEADVLAPGLLLGIQAQGTRTECRSLRLNGCHPCFVFGRSRIFYSWLGEHLA
jgi:hypothetical protein